jgi:hypothetical protein
VSEDDEQYTCAPEGIQMGIPACFY